MKSSVRIWSFLGLLASANLVFGQAPQLGLFSDQADIGSVARPGSGVFDAARDEYRLAGGGANMWFTNDAFHFVSKKLSGDFTFTADVRWIGTAGNEHRKACLLIRQTLDAGSAYADIALHGNGLTSLQFRDVADGLTHEIQANLSAPGRLRLEKHGDYISMSLAPAGGEFHPAGGYLRVPFKEPFYVGLGVCAHDNNAIEEAIFSNVVITPVDTPTNAGAALIENTLEAVTIASTDRRVIYQTRDHIEAPNWSRDGQYFLFNRNGRIYKLPVTNGTPQLLDTGTAIKCNNDHGISPDGKSLAVSDGTGDGKSRIYLLPIGGGPARQITPLGPSYWHGWSPDGKTLAYCGERNGEFDIYTMPIDGGAETRLTTAIGLDDGPDYSPDGKWIYFNSERTGWMQIWRMKPDGSNQEQVTSDDCNNWFAHPSPDGKWIVFLSYAKDVSGHPGNKDVMLRLMPATGGNIQVLAKLFGGQGTINVPSWSPDSRQLAFVSYQLVYP
jgi:Tol biopolymer transport system component/regulation of enolase protein 1 (concanavalin A-like superfamily)